MWLLRRYRCLKIKKWTNRICVTKSKVTITKSKSLNMFDVILSQISNFFLNANHITKTVTIKTCKQLPINSFFRRKIICLSIFHVITNWELSLPRASNISFHVLEFKLNDEKNSKKWNTTRLISCCWMILIEITGGDWKF